MQSIRPATAADIGLLATLSALWASAFIAVELAVKDLPPLTVATLRILLAAVILIGVAWVRRYPLPRQADLWRRIVVIGFFNSAAPFFLLSWGQQYVNGGLAAVLMASGTFVALILSHFTTLDDRLTLPKVLGLMVGFGGVVVLVGVSALTGKGSLLSGQFALIGAASCYAIAGVMTRRIAHVAPPMAATLVLTSAAVYMVPLALLIDRPWTATASPTAIAALVYLGIAPTAIAYLIRFHLIKQVGATFVAQVGYLIPLFAVLWSWLFFGRVPESSTWLALALILIGIHLSRQPARKRPSRPLVGSGAAGR